MTEFGPGVGDTGGLSGQLKRGAAMAAIGLVVCQVVIVIQTIVLGRLLGPELVGIFAAGTVTIEFLMVFQSPLSQALVQRERDLEDAANTVLVVTFVTGLLIGVSVLAASPLIGDLFHDSRVSPIAAATSGLLVLNSFGYVPNGLMQRAFQFKPRMIIDPAVKIAFASVSILFATFGFGAWAMVIGSYASATVGLVLSWWIAKWRPFRGHFSFRIWRELAAFSVPLALAQIGERAREMFEQVLVGRSLGTANLGQFRYGYRIAWLPPLAIIQICCYVLFPAFARIAGDRERFRDAFVRALGWIWFATLPATALLVVVGQPVVVLLLGEQWRSAGAATAAMAGVGLGMALISVAMEAIKGAGRPSLLNWMTALSFVLGLGLILLLLPFGLVGVSIAISLTYLIVGCVSVELARSVVAVSLRDIVACLAPSTLSASTAFAVVFPLEHYLVLSDRHSEPLGVASIAAECLLFTLVYLGVLRSISPSRYRSIRAFADRTVARLRGAAHRQL